MKCILPYSTQLVARRCESTQVLTRYPAKMKLLIFPCPIVSQYLNWFQCTHTYSWGGLPTKHTMISNMICKLNASCQITWHWSKVGAHCIVHGLGWALRFEHLSYTRNSFLSHYCTIIFLGPLALHRPLHSIMMLWLFLVARAEPEWLAADPL